MEPRRHRDIYRSFYTTDDRLVSYMVSLLALRDGEACLEPAAGSGCFVDRLFVSRKALRITAIEIASAAVRDLREKYAEASNVEILEQDFLTSGADLFDTVGTFDKIIGNPPYGGWQDYERRTRLKACFSGHYVRETYGLFLIQSLSRLRADGRLVFIVPDTFLYLHLQKGLRKLLLERYSIASIDVFPSSLFPGGSFGYAKLCIITIDNRPPSDNHRVRIRHCESTEALTSSQGEAIEVDQRSILKRQDYGFPLRGHTAETALIDTTTIRLGDVADCVTGIYTGNDTAFLRRSTENPRGAGKYMEIDLSRVCPPDHIPLSLDGLTGQQAFIPLLKGGGSPYLKPEIWFIDWSREAVARYRMDRKARFQNSSFYFRRGIGFPMVTSGRATASTICEYWLFDQSVVGVFPRQPELFGFLLAFLNSAACWKLLRQINPSANNSARYLRKLPIVLPPLESLAWFNKAVDEYISKLASGTKRDDELERRLELEVARIYDSVSYR